MTGADVTETVGSGVNDEVAIGLVSGFVCSGSCLILSAGPTGVEVDVDIGAGVDGFLSSVFLIASDLFVNWASLLTGLLLLLLLFTVEFTVWFLITSSLIFVEMAGVEAGAGVGATIAAGSVVAVVFLRFLSVSALAVCVTVFVVAGVADVVGSAFDFEFCAVLVVVEVFGLVVTGCWAGLPLDETGVSLLVLLIESDDTSLELEIIN